MNEDGALIGVENAGRKLIMKGKGLSELHPITQQGLSGDVQSQTATSGGVAQMRLYSEILVTTPNKK